MLGTEHYDIVYRTGRQNENASVCLVGAYYKRKGLERLRPLLQNFPERRFTWYRLGDHSSSAAISNYLLGLQVEFDNFSIVNVSFGELHKKLATHTFFLSLSTIEGGPIPLLECMALGLYPVVSQTGFASDVIVPGVPGTTFSPFASDGRLIECMSLAIKSFRQADVELIRDAVKGYDWEGFRVQVTQHIQRSLCESRETF
jgi:glycosyltransferase involved in cell wall biosynthesis